MICIMMAVVDSNAQIVEEPQITALMNRWRNYNLEIQRSEDGAFRSWRASTGANETARRNFERKYPEYPVLLYTMHLTFI